jgi:hypothetical protein
VDAIATHLLQSALITAQKLEKKFRQLRNRGEVTARQLDDARGIVAYLRGLADQFGVESPDIDSRAARARRKESS